MNSSSDLGGDKMLMYNINSYLLYIGGEDEGMDALDAECLRELEEWRDKVEESVKAVDETAAELDAKLVGLKKGPSQKEVLEQEKAVVEKDVMKFHDMIGQLDAHLVDVQKKLEEKETALEAKVEERKRICNENEELKRKIEEQGINLRDAERMKRELQAVERDREETEAGRSGWEEKIWELDSEIGHKFKELERLVMECNQAIRRYFFCSLPFTVPKLHKLVVIAIVSIFSLQLSFHICVLMGQGKLDCTYYILPSCCYWRLNNTCSFRVSVSIKLLLLKLNLTLLCLVNGMLIGPASCAKVYVLLV